MTPAEGMELARQVHARAEAYEIEAWCAAVDVLNSGDEADHRRARELMVFVRHHQQVQAWLGTMVSPKDPPPNPTLVAADIPRQPPIGHVSWRETAIWFAEGAIGVLALFAALWIALAVTP